MQCFTTRYFTDEQLDEIDEIGYPLFPSLPPEMNEILDKVSILKTPVDAYNYGRHLPHDPIKEPLKVWLAKLHFYTGGEFHLERMLESDPLYEAWLFLKSVVHGSHIIARGYISAVEPTSDRKMGHKMDAIYIAGRREIGCIEIGMEDDQTKEMKDGLLKMPFR
ncbi:hypothetical protein INT45_009075, partial [Circinella minor]